MIKRKQRIPMLDLSTLSGEDAETAVKHRVNGRDLNLFKILMNHPTLVRRWTVFAGHVLRKQTLPARERELLILRIGWLNQAEYEWAQHVEIAKREGITEAEIERVKAGPTGGWGGDDAVLLQAVDESGPASSAEDNIQLVQDHHHHHHHRRHRHHHHHHHHD